ncbi:MAG TPA: hypothetical protein VMS17_06765 [Gemmataceae bacterium]|nr:hypothetical protein [Gemmataceae bacterium]
MGRRAGFTLLPLLVVAWLGDHAATTRADDAPEQLLPATTQVYIRWDGVESHRPAYEKSALGKMMKGDTGAFINDLYGQIQDGLSALLTVDQLLGGVAPDKLAKMQADANEAAQLLPGLSKSGFILAGEIRNIDGPDWQATLILPDSGPKPEPLAAALRLVAALNKLPVKDIKSGDITAHYIGESIVYATWWQEGKNAVLALGSDKPEEMLKRMHQPGPRLDGNPLFQRVKSFDKFETSARAFVDVAAMSKLAASRGKEFDKLIKDLGLDGLKSLVFYSGFDGDSERGLVEWDMPGPRKGLLTLLNGKPFTLADLPPLPPDVISWSMTNFDPAAFYDTAYLGAEDAFAIAAPDQVANVKGFAKAANDALGVDLRHDLIDSLGDKVVFYNSPSEGPLSLGQTVMFRVKDAKKLQDALDQAVKGLGKVSGAEVTLKRKMYHGVEMREVHVQQQGFIFVPSYVIYKDWLVIALYPQQVQGYILRAKGDMTAWKPSQRVQKSLSALPKEFISISYDDPRPTVKTVLSIAPLIGGTVNSFTPDSKFEVGSLPNAQEATEHLFPNVAVTTDDGSTLRLETRASLALPVDVTGLDAYAAFAFFSVFRFAF